MLDSDSVVIDVGRGKRIVSPSARRALQARQAICQWPGCDRPGSWCTPHHLVPWAAGGSSDLDNQVLLCWRHLAGSRGRVAAGPASRWSAAGDSAGADVLPRSRRA
ncbi:MAG TPA: HNH endonuclease signature motif containing protein [Candidatus Dormibacteraeota bacterium]